MVAHRTARGGEDVRELGHMLAMILLVLFVWFMWSPDSLGKAARAVVDGFTATREEGKT